VNITARRRKLLLLGGATVLALGVSITVGYKAADRGRSHESAGRRPWHGKIAKVSRSGADTASPGLTEGMEIGLGSEIATDGRTRARLELDDGTSVVLDRSTRVVVEDGPRTLRVKEGSVVADVAHLEGAPFARLMTATGQVAVLGTKFMLTSTEGRTSVEVVRGVVELHDGDSKVEVAAGQEGIAARGAKLEIAPVNDLAQRLAFGERLGIVGTHNEDTDLPVSGLGELRARRPNREGEKDHAVRLATHDVKVRIVGNVARTEIDETFNNDTDEVLEGLYRFPLPPGAQMERLALEVDGKLIDGSFVDKAKGAAIWRGALQAAAPETPKPKDEIIWVPGPWHDPALLEWQRGGRFELKIFPIPKHGSRRVVLAYTETVAPVAGARRYVYPLPQSTASDLKIGTFSVDLQVLGHDAKNGVRVRGYEVAKAEAGEAGGERFQQTISGFVPSGDLGLEYTMADRTSDVTAWGYRDAEPPAAPVKAKESKPAAPEAGYVALALRPKLPGWTDVRPRDVVIAVDAGRSMFGERFARARRLAVQMAQEMDRRDRVAVLACDVDCRAMAGPFVGAGSAAAHDAEKFLSTIEPDGASDLVGAVRAAEGLGGHDRARDLRVVLISDGLASAGYRRADRIAAEVRDAMAGPRDEVITVPIGTDADVNTLQEIARGGGGVVVPYAPGEMLEVAALDVVNATCGTTLRDVEVVLPAGLRDVAPQKLSPIRAGGEAIVTARLDGERATGDVTLRGKVGGEAFEAKYPIELLAKSEKGNAFVPRLYAAARIADRERDAEALSGEAGKKLRTELVSLSQKYAVPSRFTSLLVLESEAMFQAFGIDRSTRADAWTGETLATGSEASSREPVPQVGDLGTDEAAPLGSAASGPVPGGAQGFGSGGGLGLSGIGSGGAGRGSTSETTSPRRHAAQPQSTPTPAPATPPPPPAATATAPPAPKKPTLDRNPFDTEAEKKSEDKSDVRRREPPTHSAAPPAQELSGALGSAPSGGQFMKRVWVRRFALSNGAPPAVAADKLVVARAAVQAAPDERGKYNKLVRLLSANGQTEELGEVLSRWSSRDPLDGDAIAARADLAARAGDRPRALRILDGVASGTTSSSADVPMLEALATAHERAGERTAACAFRIAVAEIRSDALVGSAAGEDADRIARAVACEREGGRPASADRWLSGRGDRGALEAAVGRFDARSRSGSGPVEDINRGDILVDATWDASANEDIDLAVIDPNGIRLGWVGRSRNVRVGDATSRRHEALAVSSGLGGAFTVEIVRVAGGNAPVSGNLTVRAGGERLAVPFVLSGSMTQVARVNARFEQQLVPLSGINNFAVGPFDRGAAASALASVSVTHCHSGDGVFGQGHARIDFTPSGVVSTVLLDPPFAGSVTGRCVQGAYRRARVPAFAGNMVTVSKSFVVSP
jgi:hypothetical protein